MGTLWNSISQEKVTIKGARIGRIYRERPWEREVPPDQSELLTAVSIAALCGLSALLVVPGYDMYELYRYGVTDSEYCGGGGNTILFGYDLGCDVDWRQIFVVSGIVWTFGTAVFFPIVVAVSFIVRFLQTRP